MQACLFHPELRERYLPALGEKHRNPNTASICRVELPTLRIYLNSMIRYCRIGFKNATETLQLAKTVIPESHEITPLIQGDKRRKPI